MKSTLLLCALAFSLTRTHAADDPGFVPMFNGLDLRGWKVPTSAEARWKPGKWYRLRLKLDGKQATATLTETHEANPQTMEATLEAPAKGPIGLADLGTPVTFANFFLRE